MVAMDAGTAIGVAMYVETVFGLPGLGRTMIRALAGLQGYDLPVILAITLVSASAIIVLNLIADLVLLAIDPTVAQALPDRRVPVLRTCRVKILIVSQMYPGPADPDLGPFVAQQERALRERGHEVALAVLDRRAGGKARFLELRRRVRAAATPDVVWAHFLVPSGLFAAEVDAPLVVTAHGRDVRNIGAVPGVARLTRRVVQRAATVIAVSDYLRRELEERLPEARGKTEVIDSGVDLERFDGVAPAAALEHPAFVHVGSLTNRKNVVRLADAFAQLGRGSLTFVGDGPLRTRLEGRDRVRVVGRVPHDRDPRLAERRRRRVRTRVDRAVRPGAARGDGVQP